MELPPTFKKAGIGAAALIAFAASIYVIGFWKSEWAWNDAWPRHRTLNVRHRMADGLAGSDEQIGKSQAQVVALLGEPPQSDKFREFDLVYALGAERGFIGIDSEWLAIDLDARGRVSVAEIVRD